MTRSTRSCGVSDGKQGGADRARGHGDEGWADDEPLDRARQYYERKRRFAARAGKVEDDGYEDAAQVRERVLRRLYQAERQAIVELRNAGDISNEVMHRLERELDLEESYFEQ